MGCVSGTEQRLLVCAVQVLAVMLALSCTGGVAAVVEAENDGQTVSAELAGEVRLWTAATTTPTVPWVSDSAVELGVKFTSDQAGSINGLRFYKGNSSNTGPHIGHLWTSGGTRLASVTFSNETAGGWQVARFATPVRIAANTTYVASYFTPTGYAYSQNYFTSGFNQSPLHVPANGGVYSYGASGVFPTSTYLASNYWVDVIFSAADTASPTVPAGLTATASSPSQVNLSWAPSTDNVRVAGYRLFRGGTQIATVTGTSYQNTGLAASTTYSYTVAAYDAAGNTSAQSAAASATTLGASAATGTSIWSVTATPSVPDVAEGASVELGVKFKSDVNGSITGIRFYKGTGNTGTHLGRLWTTGGTQLATVTFVGETASGWQEAKFAAPVAIAAGSTYIASYYAPVGHYSFDSNGLANDVNTPPLHALSSSSSGGNGVYVYGTGGGFPSQTYAASNYWVDVVFTAATASIWPATAVPSVPDVAEGASVELGVKFKSDVNGSITGIRFYKGTGNTGTHLGRLWTTGGTQLATVTFVGETASGWQEAKFAAPVAIAAGSTYIASYYAPVGHYSFDSNGLANDVNTPPLHALSSSSSGGNGVYLYATGGGFPSQTYAASNYWVDVVFQASGGSSPPPPSSTKSVSLAWDASTSSVAGYNVYRGDVTGGFYAKINSSLLGGLSYTDSGVVSGRTYYYVATAVGSDGSESANSNEVQTTIPL
jgi:chitodextrinase